MATNDFNWTHEIEHGPRMIPVRRERGHNGGHILYTEAEWAGCEAADWEQDQDGTVLFQGQSTNATLVRRGWRQEKAAASRSVP